MAKRWLHYLMVLIGIWAVIDWYVMPLLMGVPPMHDWWHLL